MIRILDSADITSSIVFFTFQALSFLSGPRRISWTVDYFEFSVERLTDAIQVSDLGP